MRSGWARLLVRKCSIVLLLEWSLKTKGIESSDQLVKCYSEPSHFVLGALGHGEWAETEADYGEASSSESANQIVSGREFNAGNVSAWYEWRMSGSRVALGNVSYGNLRCPLEEYAHACGAGLGSNAFDWHIAGLQEWDISGKGDRIGIEKRFPDWREKWLMHDGLEAWKHRRWQPSNCRMPFFDGAALVEALQGRTLRLIGDSTMRQLFIATACMIPQEYIKEYIAKWENRHGPRFRLLGGSAAIFHNGGSIIYFDGRVETAPFLRGKARDIVVTQADLHQQGRIRTIIQLFADNVNKAFESDSISATNTQKNTQVPFRQALGLSPWQIYIQQSVQHFLQQGDHTRDSTHGCTVNGAYTKVGLQKFHTCRMCSHYNEAMQAQEARLAGLIAVISNDPLRNAGTAHPTTFYTDCTHFCQPGPQDSLATSLAAIIVQYQNATNFYDRVTASNFWQDQRKKKRTT